MAAQKVGGGWVEVVTKVTQKEIRKARREIEHGLDGIKARIVPEVTKAAILKVRKEIQQGLSNIKIRVTLEVSKAEIARTKAAINAAFGTITVKLTFDVNQASLARARAQIQAALQNAQSNVGVRVVNPPPGRRPPIGRNSPFGRGPFGGPLSTIANAFQLNGPIGGAIILALLGAVAAAAVPLGAMLGGIIAAALVFPPAIIAAIIGWWDNPKVERAVEKLGDTVKEKVIEPLSGPFGNNLTNIINNFTDKINEWAPALISILEVGNRFLTLLSEGAMQSGDILIPAFDELMGSKFTARIMKTFVDGLVVIAQAIADGWNDILGDKQAQDGMVRGLKDFFGLVALIIGFTFDFVRWASRTWEQANMQDESGVSDLQRIKAIWDNIWEFLKSIGRGVKQFIDNTDITLEDVERATNLLRGIGTFIEKILGIAGTIVKWGTFDPFNFNEDSSRFEKPDWMNWDWWLGGPNVDWNPFNNLRTTFQGVARGIKDDWTQMWSSFGAIVSNSTGGIAAAISNMAQIAFGPLRNLYNQIIGALSGVASKAGASGKRDSNFPGSSGGGGGKPTGGGRIPIASGGLVSGRGTGTSDSIPAMVSNGEFVVNAAAASRNLGLLNALNNGAAFSPVVNVYVDGVKRDARVVVRQELNNMIAGIVSGRRF